MLTPSNLKVIKFTSYCCTSDGTPVESTGRDVCVLFNKTQIDEKEVSKLIDNGMDEYDVFSVEDLLQYCCQNDVELRATNIQEKDIGEWDDDCEVNKIVCPNSVFEEYFK